jgi:RNA polymerase sigma factor (sigma-70 family)
MSETIVFILDSLYKIPLLSKEHTHELALKAWSGEDGEGKFCVRSRNKLVEHNLRLVVNIAKKLNPTVPLEDKISMGNFGLIKAASKYNPHKLNPESGKPYSFSTYATWWITQNITREMMNTESVIRVPIHVLKSFNRCSKVLRIMEKHGYIKPTDDDIYAFVEEYNSNDARKDKLPLEDNDFRFRSVPHVLLDCVLYETFTGSCDEYSEQGFIAAQPDCSSESIEVILDNQDREDLLDLAMSGLSDREAFVIKSRNGLKNMDPLTLEQIGDMVGLTRERIRQIQVKSNTIIKSALKRCGVKQEHVL